MPLLDFLEYKTLLACECVLAIVFTVLFFGIHRIFPQVRGAFPIAMSYGFLVPETIFLALGGHVSPVISVLMANTLTLSSMIAMYEAIVQFTGVPNRRWLLWFLAFTSFAVVYFNTEVHPNMLPCVISLAAVMACIRGFTAMALFRRARHSTQRTTMVLFGLFITLLASINLADAQLLMRRIQSSGLTNLREVSIQMRAVEMIGIAVSGVFFLVLTSREMVSRRRMENHRDALTGTFDRSGLELNMAIELERSNRSNQPFSIAMVEVNDLKKLIETEGRAAGNATLREVGEAIASELRGTDQVGRFSTDLFLIVLSHTTQQEAFIVAERIAATAGKLSMLKSGQPVTLRVGITESAPHDLIEQMVQRAVYALLRAKSNALNAPSVVLADRSAYEAAEDAQISVVA